MALAACGSTPPPRPAPSEQPTVSGDLAQQGPYLPDAYLTVCNMSVSNRPVVNAAGQVKDFAPLILVQDRVVLAAVPTNDACVSSGFGPRFGRVHKGLDLQSKPASMVFSGGPGVIREVNTQRGFGLQVLIDHGSGVYTRYAHLANVEPNIQPGARIGFGQPIGLMGRSGNATAIHLHYEILVGGWGPRESYGLEATNPLAWPAYAPPAA
ncbi:MAG: M23 family metallopeptidase [Pseudomonadota bacterium]